MGKIQVAARFIPWLLLLFLVASKVTGIKARSFYPILLCAEYTIWPIWFYFVQDELTGYYAYLFVYLAITAFLLKIPQDNYSKYFAAFYIVCSTVIVFNVIAFKYSGFPVAQLFYDLYFELMSTIMILMCILGLWAMYGNGKGGARVNVKSSYRDYNNSDQNVVARVEDQ